MIKLAAFCDSTLREAITQPGGFGWWYADLRSPGGDGLVLIWSFGLPFLPGSRLLPRATERPAVSLAVYRGGAPWAYLLQLHPETAATLRHDGREFTFGRSHFALSRQRDKVRLQAHLDEPVFGSEHCVRGEIEVEGPGVPLARADDSSAHVWAPETIAGWGSASLSYGHRKVNLSGSAYLDSNASRLPLQEQSLRQWRWGRVSFPDHTLVYYDIAGLGGRSQQHVFRQYVDGRLQRLDCRAEFSSATRGLFGLRSARAVEVVLQGGSYRLQLPQLVDDGPFYQRLLAHGCSPCGQRGEGFAEVVAADRVDTPWQRPFVRMRTHHVADTNSRWLPLFHGPRTDRAPRLLRALTGMQRMG